MTDKEARLAAFFAADEPPAQDDAFVRSLATRMERRGVLEAVLDNAPLGVAAIAVAATLGPSISPGVMQLFDAMGVALPMFAAAAIVAGTFWIASRLQLMPPLRELGL